MTFWVFSEAAVAGSASGPRDGIDSMSDSDGSQAGWIRIRNDPGRAGLQSVIDSERQPPGADLGGAVDGEHRDGGADNRPGAGRAAGRAGLQSVIYSERQPGAELGGAGDGEHGGADTEQTRDRRGAGVPDCTESVT